MKTKAIIFFILLTSVIACKKKDKEPVYTIEGNMSYNKQDISKINIGFDERGVGEVLENSGISTVEYIESSQELLFHFEAKAGELYKVSWQDSWWDQFTAGSIYVTALEEDKTTTYFPEDRLIQMRGSPKAISIENDGLVYLKVRGYNNEINGSFALDAIKLNKDSSDIILLDSTMTYIITPGELKLCKIQVEKDSLYTVTIDGSQYTGAHGDEIEVNVTALRENLNANYFFEEPALASFWVGHPNEVQFTALATETVYFTIIGAYWWDPRTVKIKVTKG